MKCKDESGKRMKEDTENVSIGEPTMEKVKPIINGSNNGKLYLEKIILT